MMISKLYEEVKSWIPKGSKVLDLGTGNGRFLADLIKTRNVHGEAVEKDPEMVAQCIEQGLIVHHGDILEGLDQYGSKTFDYVLLLGTFEELIFPIDTIKEALRVGSKVIIAYNNFLYYRLRFKMMFQGRMPITTKMPHNWYDTPNIHFFSTLDFINFSKKMNLKLLKTASFNRRGHIKLLPNLRGEEAVALLSRN